MKHIELYRVNKQIQKPGFDEKKILTPSDLVHRGDPFTKGGKKTVIRGSVGRFRRDFFPEKATEEGRKEKEEELDRRENGLKYILRPFASRPFEVHVNLSFSRHHLFHNLSPSYPLLKFFIDREIGKERKERRNRCHLSLVALVVCASKIVPCVNKIKCGIIFLFRERTRGLSFDICSNIGFSISGERRFGMEKFYSTFFSLVFGPSVNYSIGN